MISVKCATCGKKFSLRDAYAGRKAKCACGAVLTIPSVAPPHPDNHPANLPNESDLPSAAATSPQVGATVIKPKTTPPALPKGGSLTPLEWFTVPLRFLIAFGLLGLWIGALQTGTQFMSFETLMGLAQVRWIGTAAAAIAFGTLLGKNKPLAILGVFGMLAAICSGFIGWTKASQLMIGTQYHTAEKGNLIDLSFPQFDSKVGFGALTNPAQWTKTSQQVEADVRDDLGRDVQWAGVVVDVRDNQILIQQRYATFKNEVALVVGWWDEWRLPTVNRGQWIRYRGILAGVGDPYPYTITNGSIVATEDISTDEAERRLGK